MEVEYIRKATKRVGEFQVKHPILVLAIVIIFTILILPGFSFVYFDTSNENFLPQHDPVVESLFVVGSDFGGGFNTLTLLFFADKEGEEASLDLRDPVFLKKIDLIAKSIQKLEYVNSVQTPVSTLKQLNDGVLPNEKHKIETLISKNPQIKTFFNSDYSIARIQIIGNFGEQTPDFTRQYNEISYIVESVDLPLGVTSKIWGDLVQFKELDANLGSTLGISTILSFIMIFILYLIFYRSIVISLFSILPIMLALLWTVGTMGYINLPFTYLTSGFIALVIGLGDDYSIQLVHSIKHMTKNGKKIEEAIIETMEEIGEGIFAGMLTTLIGFFSLILASLLVTQRLGLTLALSIFFIFSACILLIPPILLLEDRFFNRNRKRK